MKRSQSRPSNTNARKLVGTVSAAALMLGVSQAATVGFNFQSDWGATSPYTGKPVTATAFSIAPAGWENLTPMPTGYGGGSIPGPGPFLNLNQIIDTTTSSGGLNPLPKGSISITWSATAGNCTGFSGYGPGYGAPNPHPGEQEVYYSFLRDEANIYTSPDGGPIPYHVTITGLRSVWTNYAIQIINATDSGSLGFTNTYIAGAGGTDTVTYPSVPLGPQVVGGLSTATGLRTDDTLDIYGAPAANTSQGRLASTIAGFIITDKPVISMSPQPALVCGGDTVIYSGYAVGVPPLAYQWRKDGQPIAGATTSSLGLTNVAVADFGNYDLTVSNAYGVAVSAPVSMDHIVLAPVSNLVIDSNPQGPEHDGINKGASWVGTSTDSVSRTRTGVMTFSSAATNQLTVAGGSNFDATNGTYSFWMRSSGVSDNGSGLPAVILDRRADNGDGFVVGQLGDGTLQVLVGPSSAPVNAVATTSSVSDNKWHLIAVTYDVGDNGGLSIFVDGALIATTLNGGVPWAWHAGQQIELGTSHDKTDYQPYNGSLDDVRFYSRVLLTAEVASIRNTDALVDTTTLGMQLNFTAAPGQGLSLSWKATDVILQSADSASGPYTDLGAVSPYLVAPVKTAKFYRYHGHTARTPSNPVIANPYLM